MIEQWIAVMCFDFYANDPVALRAALDELIAIDQLAEAAIRRSTDPSQPLRGWRRPGGLGNG